MAFAKQINSTTPNPIIFKNIDEYLSHGNSNLCQNESHEALNNQRGHRNRSELCLCIKGVPSHLNEASLKNILSCHGNVTNVTAPKAEHCSYYFADCATESDVEAIIKGMQKNEHKMRIELKTGKRNQDNIETESNLSCNRSDINASKRNHNNRQHSNHSDGGFNDKNHNRRGRNRNSENESQVSPGGYNSKQILREKPISLNYLYQKQVSSYISIQPKQESNRIVQMKQENSIKKNETFRKVSNEISSELKLGPCRTCKKQSNKICERCDEFYCSIECQKRDWATHRLYCFKMPKLITINIDDYKENSNINNMSIKELKQLKYTNDSNNRQNNMPNNEFKQSEFRQNGPILNGTGAVPKSNTSPNKKNDFQHKHNNANGHQSQSKSQDARVQSKVNPFLNKPTRTDVPNVKPSNENNSKFVRENKPQELRVNAQDPPKSKVIPAPTRAEIPKSGQIVIMTNFEDTDKVYVRSNEKSDNIEYLGNIRKVQICSENANNLKKLPNVKEYVVTMYEGIWSRAIVLDNRNPEKILIAYIDFGNSEFKKLSELRELVQECYNLKRYPIMIYLKNLSNIVPNDEFQNYMRDISHVKQLKIIYEPNDIKDNKIMAELFILETNENINNKCIELLNVSVPNDCETTESNLVDLIDPDQPIMFEDLKMIPFPTGDNISVIIVDQSVIQAGFVHCIPSSELKELHFTNFKINRYAESKNHNYSPRKNEMCIAKYNNETWYRAYCYANDDENNPDLIFPDYGYSCSVSIENIRKYPKTIELPCKTHECLINGIDYVETTDNSEKLGQRLRELLPLNKPKIVSKVECVNECVFVLHLPDVIDTLGQEGLI